MYNVIFENVKKEFESLNDALVYAKSVEHFVVIKGDNFEVVGRFGVDSIKDGRCPDCVAYDWNKSSRIGRVKKERV